MKTTSLLILALLSGITLHLEGDYWAGGKMKETGTEHWSEPNTGATNESGFTALPGGKRWAQWNDFGTGCYFWSSTENSPGDAFSRSLQFNNHNVGYGMDYKSNGLSVRCVKD
jgi:uncharacterized protein (TIGR02145 family)